jgi:hypothetical protein
MNTSAISEAVAGVKAVGKLAVDLIHLRDEADRQAKVIELQGVILATQGSAFAAQTAQAEMAEEIRSLKEEIASVRAWEKTKQRYQLHEIEAGRFAYGVKAESKESDPAHWVCATCIEHEERVILQLEQKEGRRYFYVCPRCRTELYLGHGFEAAAPKYLE